MTKNAIADNDVLTVEIDSYITNYAIANLQKPTVPIVLDSGKHTIEIMGSQYLGLESDVEDEQDEWKRALAWEKKRIAKAIADKMEELGITNESDLPPEARKAALTLNFLNLDTAANKFFQDVGRPRKPLKSVKLLVNKGPRVDDKQAEVERERAKQSELVSALLEFARTMQASKKGE